MSREEALCQSLAACGAVLIAFIGVCHEFVGHIVVPWGPALLGGAVGWHGLGVLTIASGLLMLGGALRLIRFPVVPMALVFAAIGIALGAFAAAVHHEFHMFAFAAAAAGATTAFFHRKAAALSSFPSAGPV
jgi:hypothetical protein